MDRSKSTIRTADLDAGVLHLAGTGETRDLLLSFDWSASPLGPIEQWPQSLKTAVSLPPLLEVIQKVLGGDGAAKASR